MIYQLPQIICKRIIHIFSEEQNTPNFDITVLKWLPDEPSLVKYSASLPVPAYARLLRLWVRIPPGAWMSVVSVVHCEVEIFATG